MPRTINDIEQDSAPDIRVARRALNSTLQDNTKIDRVSDEIKDDQSNKRTDDDGGQDKSKNPDSVFYKGDDKKSDSEESSDDENLGNFVRDLFGDTKEDEEELDRQGESKSNEDTKPPTDEELDSDKGDVKNDGEESGSDRSGQFGSGNVDDPPPTDITGSSGLTGTEIKSNFSTFVSGFDLNTSLRIGLMKNPDGTFFSGPINETNFNTLKTENFDVDQNGNVTINGIKYRLDQISDDIPETVLQAFIRLQREDVNRLLNLWGYQSTPSNQNNTPDDQNPATNPNDPEQKFEPKLKANDSPQGAPTNVENSAALTTAKLRELNGKSIPPGASIDMWATHIEYNTPKYPTSKGYYGIRDQKSKTDGLGFAKDEYSPNTKLIGAVKNYFNSQWEKLITGAPIPVSKNSEDLNLIDYPIIMNFTEVGVWNKKVPYVADTQTEQHRMLYIGFSNSYNMGNWGIGSYGANTKNNTGGFANWAEQPHWCGIFTQHCISHGGYRIPGKAISLAGANTINNVYFNSSLQKLKQSELDDVSESFGNVPTYLDSSGKKVVVKQFLDKNDFGKKTGKSEYTTDIYRIMLEGATYKETTESEVTMVPDGKKLKPKTKTKVNREKIPIAIQESLLPNPLMIYFIGGIHFTKEGMTNPGKKLLEHFLSQRGWEVSIISRGGHIEVCPYVNPDGTIARFGGNTGGGTTVSRDGGKFAAKPNSIWNFSAGAKAGTYVVFTKVVPKGGSQKIEPTMNGVFRRTPIVDSYYRSINNKTILPTLKNTLYDQIVERE
jgi:hypothetical protein